MKLKQLALIVALCLLVSLAISVSDLARYYRQYPADMKLTSIIRLMLSIPLPIFFLYVWKRSKDA